MTLHGKIHNGTVVFDGSPNLPEGAAVTVFVQAASAPPSPRRDRLSEEELRRRNAIMDAITALPIEGSGEPFSGRDHDQVLYGKPQ